MKIFLSHRCMMATKEGKMQTEDMLTSKQQQCLINMFWCQAEVTWLGEAADSSRGHDLQVLWALTSGSSHSLEGEMYVYPSWLDLATAGLKIVSLIRLGTQACKKVLSILYLKCNETTVNLKAVFFNIDKARLEEGQFVQVNLKRRRF